MWFVDVIAAFSCLLVITIGSASFVIIRKRIENKQRPPVLSDYETHIRRYMITGNEEDLKLALESEEVQD